MTGLILLGMSAIWLLGLFIQLFTAPMMAKSRGKDGGVWFFIALLMFAEFWGVALIYPFLFGFPLMALWEGGDGLSVISGMMIGVLVFLLAFSFIPTIILMLSQPQDPYSNRNKGYGQQRPPSFSRRGNRPRTQLNSRMKNRKRR